MNEHEREQGTGEGTQARPMVEAKGSHRTPNRADLVVDLTGIRTLDVTSLALLLTAQQSAEKEDRAIWLAGVPMNVWQALHEMGLGRFFKPFPVSGAVVV